MYEDVLQYSTPPPITHPRRAPANSFSISMVLWVELTSFTINVFDEGKFLLPIFNMGKFFERDGKRLLPLANQIHHAVCAGHHIGGRCFKALLISFNLCRLPARGNSGLLALFLSWVYNGMEVIFMDTKDIILELRTKRGLSQEELAEKVFVTRQAVSRWENGDTTPNTETLKLLSKLFDVSINTLLGSPRQLICQCCGMPLEDACISKEKDGFFNEEYCKWCYADGEYMYHDMDDLIEVCVNNMAGEHFSAEQARAYMRDLLPKLNYWKNHTNLEGAEAFEAFKKQLIGEINALYIEGMPKLEKLNALVGGYINMEYQLPNGSRVKFLDDGATYLGNQLVSELEKGRCFGIAANADFILVCTYEENGENPELVVYKKR